MKFTDLKESSSESEIVKYYNIASKDLEDRLEEVSLLKTHILGKMAGMIEKLYPELVYEGDANAEFIFVNKKTGEIIRSIGFTDGDRYPEIETMIKFDVKFDYYRI